MVAKVDSGKTEGMEKRLRRAQLAKEGRNMDDNKDKFDLIREKKETQKLI